MVIKRVAHPVTVKDGWLQIVTLSTQIIQLEVPWVSLGEEPVYVHSRITQAGLDPSGRKAHGNKAVRDNVCEVQIEPILEWARWKRARWR